jgi:hypothetical protein
MKKNLSFILLATTVFLAAALAGEGKTRYPTVNCDGNEIVILAASTCSQWITVTIDFREATWAQTTINVPTCYDWWSGAGAAEGQGPVNRIEAGHWLVDPVTYEMLWQQSEPAGGIDAGQDYPMTVTALSF